MLVADEVTQIAFEKLNGFGIAFREVANILCRKILVAGKTF
jgi:hypothetical protein